MSDPSAVLPDPSSEPTPSPQLTPGLGATLRVAREAGRLSQADVSQVIRFSVRQIDALEREDFDSLPGSTVIRGFVRSYAKFLKLDPELLLSFLNPVVPIAESEVREPANMGAASTPLLSTRTPAQSLLIGVIGLIVLIFGAWLLVSRDAPDGKGETGEGLAIEKVEEPTAVVVPIILPTEQSGTLSAVAAATSASPLNLATGSANLPPPHPGLRLEFVERSWIEVRDARQTVVFVGEYPGGTRQNIEGKGPFTLWIGRASGVKVFFGERSIDLRPSTREDVARLTVE